MMADLLRMPMSNDDTRLFVVRDTEYEGNVAYDTTCRYTQLCAHAQNNAPCFHTVLSW